MHNCICFSSPKVNNNRHRSWWAETFLVGVLRLPEYNRLKYYCFRRRSSRCLYLQEFKVFPLFFSSVHCPVTSVFKRKYFKNNFRKLLKKIPFQNVLLYFLPIQFFGVFLVVTLKTVINHEFALDFHAVYFVISGLLD